MPDLEVPAVLIKDSGGSEPLVFLTAVAGAAWVVPHPLRQPVTPLDLISSLFSQEAIIDIWSDCDPPPPLQFKNDEGRVLECSVFQKP